jgi:hypothetical protein
MIKKQQQQQQRNQLGFLPGMQEYFNICKSIKSNTVHIKNKDKNYMIILIKRKRSPMEKCNVSS